MLQRRHAVRQYAVALAHAGDADKVGPEVSAAMCLLALPVEDRRHAATGSHVVNRGTPVAPCRLKAQRERVTRVGSPCIPVFPVSRLVVSVH